MRVRKEERLAPLSNRERWANAVRKGKMTQEDMDTLIKTEDSIRKNLKISENSDDTK